MKERALVTGGKGFIGHNLSLHLKDQGYNVATFDKTDGQDVVDRQMVFDSIKENDVVFHFAGVLGTHELQDKAIEATAINVIGALNVFDAARRHGARVVLAAKPTPWLNTYTITKEAAEKFAHMYFKEHGVDIRIGRFFNFYGPGQKIEHVQKAVPNFIMKALQNEPIPIYGSGNQTGDFIHTDDAVKAIAILGTLEGLNGETIEVGTGQETSVNFLAETIIRFTDSRSITEHLPMRNGEDPETHLAADTRKMTSLLRFKPSVGLEDGLKATIDWYRHKYFPERQPFTSAPTK